VRSLKKFTDIILNRNGTRVLEFLEVFKDRLKPADVENIRNFVEHNEWGITFEVLCAQIYEWESSISQKEYDDLKGFAKAVPIDWEYDYLEELINKAK
jgi:hypothetical protein